MSPTTHTITGQTHAFYDEEHAAWRKKIQTWQAEQDAMLAELDQLRHYLVSEGEQLADELERIHAHDYQESVHDTLGPMSPEHGEFRAWMERCHERLADSHEAQRHALERLGAKHDLARVVLHELVGLVRGEEPEA